MTSTRTTNIMSSHTIQPYNWSIQAIPAAFLLGIVPHGYFSARLFQATKGQISNAMPRANLDAWKGKISTELWNHLSRTRSAHLNSMEVFPLFAVAMVAGNAANIPASDMNSMAVSFLAARSLYIGLYMSVKSNTASYARSAVYAWSVSIPIMCLWKAGKILGQDRT